jgi:predicted transposase YdaD
MILPEGLKQEFWVELRAYEEMQRMPYITSVEEIGFARGRQEGRQEGLQEGEQRGRQQAGESLVCKLLKRRLNLEVVPEELQARIHTLSIAQLEALGEALFDFTTMGDLTQWLNEQKQGRQA